jgi:hypothetical protein
MKLSLTHVTWVGLLTAVTWAASAKAQVQRLGPAMDMESVPCLPIWDMNKKVVCAANKVVQFKPAAKYILNNRFGVNTAFTEVDKHCRNENAHDSHKLLYRYSCLNTTEGWHAVVNFVVTTPPDPSLPVVLNVSQVVYQTCVSADADKELARVIAKFGTQNLLSQDDGLQYQRNNVYDAMNVYHRPGYNQGERRVRDATTALKCAGDQRLEFQIRSVNTSEVVQGYFQSLLAGRAKRVESTF